MVHNKTCPHKSNLNNVHLNIDGIQESKSGGYSLDAYTMQLQGCRTVYPIKLVKPAKKFKYDEQDHIKSTLNDVRNVCHVKNAIFDNPKRAIARCALNHASTYACEYCESAASHISLSDIEVKKMN